MGEVGGETQRLASTYMSMAGGPRFTPAQVILFGIRTASTQFLMREIAGRTTRGRKCAIQPADDTDDDGNGHHTRAHKTRRTLRCDAVVLLSEHSAMLGREYVVARHNFRPMDKKGYYCVSGDDL